MIKQKLHIKLKNAPADAPQVRCSASLSLNSPAGRDSATNKVLVCNNAEVDLLQNTGGLKDVCVFTLNNKGLPLMPCSKAKARKLVKSGKARVISLNPFTIKLTFECENKTQHVTLGIDSGFKNIGFSAVTEKKELVCGTVVLDNKTSSRLNDKRMYRKNRRNKLWYREPRWNNRGNARKEERLSPSVQRRYETHVRVVEKLKSLLPITEVIIETASFDIQKIKNPDISGVEYQQGDLKDFYNIKAYLMVRENCLCQLCSKSVLGEKVNLHHIIHRKDGGTDKADNLALLHEKCHERLHKNGLRLKPNRQYKGESVMSTIRWKLRNLGKETYGYLTQSKRLSLNIEKTHYNDAFCIADGSVQERVLPFEIRQKHRNNRSLGMQRKGFAPCSRTKRYKIQPLDMCWHKGKLFYTSGSQNKGTRVKFGKHTVSVDKLEKVYNTNNLIWMAIHPHASVGVFLPGIIIK